MGERTPEQREIFEALVNEVEDLRPISAIAARIIEMSEDDRFSAQDLGATISTDQALTVKILRLANSTFFGLPRRITTVREAIVLLGFREVRSTALAACLITDGERATHVDYRRFWLNSVIVGMLAEVLAEAERRGEDEALTAGLLYNVGRLALDQHRPDLLGESIRAARDADVSLHEAQKRRLGFTDAALGEAMVRQWNFPVPLCEAVAHHAGSLRRLDDRCGLDALVVRARRYAMAHGITDSVDDPSGLKPDSEWIVPPIKTALERRGGLAGVRKRAESLLAHAFDAPIV